MGRVKVTLTMATTLKVTADQATNLNAFSLVSGTTSICGITFSSISSLICD
jgi:hypothetical protein